MGAKMKDALLRPMQVMDELKKAVNKPLRHDKTIRARFTTALCNHSVAVQLFRSRKSFPGNFS